MCIFDITHNRKCLVRSPWPQKLKINPWSEFLNPAMDGLLLTGMSNQKTEKDYVQVSKCVALFHTEN